MSIGLTSGRRLLPRAAFLILLVAAGCAGAGSLATRAVPAGSRHVYLVSHGWHIGLVLERALVSEAAWPESRALAPSSYLEVGWGDVDFYPVAKGTTGLALRAAFNSRGSVLHVVGFDPSPTAFFPASEIVVVALSAAGYDAIARFVHAAYALDAERRPIVVGPALYGRGSFYRARGRYRLFENSNTWTARALMAGGCPIDPADTPTAGSLLAAVRRFGQGAEGPGRESEPDDGTLRPYRCYP